MVYAEFGGQTECIMGNSKIENKYYKIWTKLSRLSTHVKIGIFEIQIAYWGIGMVGKCANQKDTFYSNKNTK